MDFKKWTSFLTGVLVMAAPGLSNAAVYLITYTGHVSSGYDTTGVFGTANTNLAGLAFKTVYTLTYPTQATYFNDGEQGYTYGGTQYGNSSPVSAKLTIGGVTKNINGSYFGSIHQINGAGGCCTGDALINYAKDQTYDSAGYSWSTIDNGISNPTGNMVSSSNFINSLNYTVQLGDNSSFWGNFSFYNYRYATGWPTFSPPQVLEDAYGSMTADQVSISPQSTPGVPEPATWSLMILGFGGIGAAMRGRRKVEGAVAAC